MELRKLCFFNLLMKGKQMEKVSTIILLFNNFPLLSDYIKYEVDIYHKSFYDIFEDLNFKLSLYNIFEYNNKLTEKQVLKKLIKDKYFSNEFEYINNLINNKIKILKKEEKKKEIFCEECNYKEDNCMELCLIN